ncbi:helix-turn-helix domain-containing protein [Amycolatopsis magusensis]|uniref:AraC-like DNA-binding protein n=1 Tax=Amycolatopsis magusensis TaxID=882444 RepID=A0ABS4PHM2_9PSEU|nr:helix-turn-helix domain-containing protein [Amycolatopsis magusensis]MBP2178907.1 AraC-like DNA-binding protein [Amycolatopsis magusensis]
MSRDARELGSAWTKFQRHSFPRPSPALARYVDRYWVVSWDYEEPYRQLIVPYPNVHLVFNRSGGAYVNGVASGHQIRVLSGADGVFGVAFRPGCFRPFLGRSVSELTDTAVDASTVFRGEVPDAPSVAAVEEFLLAQQPAADLRADSAAEAVNLIIAKPEITRVALLADALGTNARALQRLFAEYVGIGPKWVIRRYRLHEVTERLSTGGVVDWAALAADLGYADQAHFTRDFKSMFGESPTHYAERY